MWPHPRSPRQPLSGARGSICGRALFCSHGALAEPPRCARLPRASACPQSHLHLHEASLNWRTSHCQGLPSLLGGRSFPRQPAQRPSLPAHPAGTLLFHVSPAGAQVWTWGAGPCLRFAAFCVEPTLRRTMRGSPGKDSGLPARPGAGQGGWEMLGPGPADKWIPGESLQLDRI